MKKEEIFKYVQKQYGTVPEYLWSKSSDSAVLRHKNGKYVDVVAEFRKDGQLVPIFFTWEDGRKYSIDRIIKIERCASRKAGGVGMMYTCMVQGKESHLFFEVDKWFMERKTA